MRTHSWPKPGVDLAIFSVLLLYHFTIGIISDKKKYCIASSKNLFTAIFQFCVVVSSLCVTSSNRFRFVNQFHVDLLPVLHQPFNSLKWFTFNFSLQYSSTIQQTGIGVLKCVGKKLSSWSNTKFLQLTYMEMCSPWRVELTNRS